MSPWDFAAPQLRQLVAYETGKPIEDLARELGLRTEEIVKLASNENPLGPSPRALEAMHAMLARAHFYPDGAGYYLREAIAKKQGLEMENIVLGNGSNEIIEFLGHAFLRPGDEVIAAKHAFVVYKLMATIFGATFIEVDDPGFAHDLPAMAAAITPRTRQLFIANPNNPTGTIVTQEQIDDFMGRVPDHVTVIFDEAYYEFLDHPPDCLKFVREGRNVIILRTFSKIQGLANLRIGYGMGSAEVIEILEKTRQPFNANGIAQAGALAGLGDDEHQARTKQVTDVGRAYLQAEFVALGRRFVPSFANFVLVHVGDGKRVFDALLRRGLIVRPMGGYKLPEWLRISVGTMEQNRKVIAALREILPA